MAAAKGFWCGIVGLALLGCASDISSSQAIVRSASPNTTLERSTSSERETAAYLDGLLAVSCPDETVRSDGEEIDVSVRSISLGRLGVGRSRVGELRYVAGFNLESTDARFGGLSGLDFTIDGALIAVSDQGNLVRFDLGEDGVTPVSARIWSLLGSDGNPLVGKAEGDSEGLAVLGDWALVSFERDHRVLAYDLGRCGIAARGAPVRYGSHGGDISAAFSSAGIDVTANRGLEALAVTRDWYLFAGLETLRGTSGPVSARPIEVGPEFDLDIEDGAPDLVGMDLVEADDGSVRLFSLHRGYSAESGNRIMISETRLQRTQDHSRLSERIWSELDERARTRFEVSASRRLAVLGPLLLNIDNFEGIAVRELDDGLVQIFVVSDDNFSNTQRNLLMVFELD